MNDKLKTYMKLKKISVNELSYKTKIPSTSIWRILKKDAKPNVERAIKIAKVLETTVEELFDNLNNNTLTR